MQGKVINKNFFLIFVHLAADQLRESFQDLTVIMEDHRQDMGEAISAIVRGRCNMVVEEEIEEAEVAPDIIEVEAVDDTTTDTKKITADTIDTTEEAEDHLPLIEWADKAIEVAKDTIDRNHKKIIEVRIEAIVDHPLVEAAQLGEKEDQAT